MEPLKKLSPAGEERVAATLSRLRAMLPPMPVKPVIKPGMWGDAPILAQRAATLKHQRFTEKEQARLTRRIAVTRELAPLVAQFGTAVRLAERMGVANSAVSQWKVHGIPLDRRAQLSFLSNGAFEE